jgi:DNA-directed RNA polymerase specialized sigma24 family protein
MPDSHSINSENFQMLLNWLDGNVEQAGEKYERIRQRLIRMFICRGCYEAEMLADLTIDRVTAKVPQISPDYVGEPAVYFYGVANKVHLEWLRAQKREREATFIDHTVDPPDDQKAYSCLEKCLENLAPDARETILEYYRDEKRAKIECRKNLAARLGVSIGALQIKASRIRSKLSTCVEKCVAGGAK